MAISEQEIEIGGKKIRFETGKIGRQAHGAVLVRCGDTVVFATACMSEKALEGVDFVPLRVDYQEKMSAAGKTLSGYIKREGRPSENEILVCRLIDRPLRPLFAKGFSNEVQLLATVWSYDNENNPDVWAVCGASTALMLSQVPFFKPVGAVRIGFIEGKFVVNPTVKELEQSKLDLVLAGTNEAIMMVEGHAQFLTEEQMLEAVEMGHAEIRKICDMQTRWAAAAGKPKLQPTKALDHQLLDELTAAVSDELKPLLRIVEKKVRETATHAVKERVLIEWTTGARGSFTPAQVATAWKQMESGLMRRMILDEGIRCDGRSTEAIRPIHIEQALLPRTHGSSLFTRGETQAVAVCTLGGESSALRYQTMEEEGTRNFYLQYFFPPYSVGEVGRMGPPGRREVGHGKLAERALQAILPSAEEFPYIIRLESNITESNGSSSMASVCGGCLALMDAGVPVKRPVAGIAMGLILEGDRYAILSDILGLEDALGDMDFKVAGDAEGITAVQMDIKIEGITAEIMRKALAQAKTGRVHILNKMLEVCPKPRSEMSAYAPRIETMKVKPSKIGVIIGPGGKQIRAIIEETGVDININDEGIVSIASNDAAALEKAKKIIQGLVEEAEVGKVYQGKVVSVTGFGCFVEIMPGKEGLVHVSELAVERIEDVNAAVKPGDEFEVKVLEINDRGQIRLSRRALLPGGEVPRERPERGDRPPRRDRDDRRGGGRDRGDREERRPRRYSDAGTPQ
jgi:polyribonucleotide nucleotidyltransferase